MLGCQHLWLGSVVWPFFFILFPRLTFRVWANPAVHSTQGSGDFGFGLWACSKRLQHYGRPSWEVMGVHGQRFGLWTWPLKASYYARLKAPLTPFYWLFSAHFFGLSAKFEHSIPWPLDLDNHSVKRPLYSFTNIKLFNNYQGFDDPRN